MTETKHIDLSLQTLDALHKAKDDLKLSTLDETIRFLIYSHSTRRGKNWIEKKDLEAIPA